MCFSKIVFVVLFLFSLHSYGQADTACASLPDAEKVTCLLEKEKVWLKGSEKIAVRSGNILTIKLNSGKKKIYKNVAFDQEIQNYDSVKTYIFIKNIKNQWVVIKRTDKDGISYELINLTTGEKTDMDGIPVFSPTMTKVMSVSGKFHGEFTPEQVAVYKVAGNKVVRKEYKHEPKALESYGAAKWTSDSRIVLKKYSWEKVTDGKPAESEVVLLFEFGEWRKVAK